MQFLRVLFEQEICYLIFLGGFFMTANIGRWWQFDLGLTEENQTAVSELEEMNFYELQQ